MRGALGVFPTTIVVSMSGDLFDVIVIGAGIVGSATAYNLAKNSQNVLLLEQFVLTHNRGSSHGQSRITRKAYTEQHYANMMTEAYQNWAELERETGHQIFKQCGLLVVGKRGSQLLTSTDASLERIGAIYHRLTPEQMAQRFPQFQFDSQYSGLYDTEAGILVADKALQGFWHMFKQYGGILRDGLKVTHVEPGRPVVVHTANGNIYKSQSLVITAGSWTNKLAVPLGLHLPLKPLRINVCFWRMKNRGFSLRESCPNLFVQNDDTNIFYMLPADEYPDCAKLCIHDGPLIDPDTHDQNRDETWDLELVQKFVRDHCPGLEDKPSIIEKCIYTMTPDKDFILDTHPLWKNIVIGAGFSGHGFKLAPVVGKILGELAVGKQPSYNLIPFRIARFLPPKLHSQL